MINATLYGRIGRDAETRPAGQTKVTSFSVATDRWAGRGKGDNGKDYKTTWVEVSIWGDRGEKVAPQLKKGRRVVVAGDVYLDSFTRKDGAQGQNLKCEARDIQVVDRDSAGQGAGSGGDAPPSQGGGDDTEIPF